VVARIWDGLLRENKVIPAVLGGLALLIFAWLVAGALIGGSGDNEEQQASNQASLAQGEDSDSGSSETPAPGVENRDSDASYGGYDEGPKDPFRQIIENAGESKAGERKAGEGTNGSRSNGGQGGEQDDRNGGDGNGGRANGGSAGSGQNGDGDGDEDFIEQRSPNDSGSQSTPARGAGQGGTGQSGAGQSGTGQVGGGGLFNSGGDLPTP
jgi:hypothetical protein